MQRGTVQTSNIKKPNRQVRFPGICTAAYELGCTPNHLRYVLKKQRTSHSLMRRYNEWKAKQAEAEKAAEQQSTEGTKETGK